MRRILVEATRVTVFDDGGADVLDGGPGRELFFAGLLDVLAHRRPNEAVYSL